MLTANMVMINLSPISKKGREDDLEFAASNWAITVLPVGEQINII